jgi:hypothetical protein
MGDGGLLVPSNYSSENPKWGSLAVRAILHAKEHTVEFQGAKAGGGVSGRHRLAARHSPRSV